MEGEGHTGMGGERLTYTLAREKGPGSVLHQDLGYIELNLINWQPHKISGTESLLTS